MSHKEVVPRERYAVRRPVTMFAFRCRERRPPFASWAFLIQGMRKLNWEEAVPNMAILYNTHWLLYSALVFRCRKLKARKKTNILLISKEAYCRTVIILDARNSLTRSIRFLFSSISNGKRNPCEERDLFYTHSTISSFPYIKPQNLMRNSQLIRRAISSAIPFGNREIYFRGSFQFSIVTLQKISPL